MNSRSCASCPMHNTEGLQRLGVEMANFDYVVALAGNPNTGKSTVFNALTGLRQHTGNWPGKTVARAEGGFRFSEMSYKLIDLPGTYSLLATSTDEEVARDFILFGSPDVTVVVVDTTRLERNLNLVLQILELTDRVVVCLNLMDEARRKRLTLDARQLARDLGVPVVPAAARQNEGIRDLLGAIHEVASGSYRTQPRRIALKDQELDSVLAELTCKVEETFPGLPNARWVALRLLEGDSRIAEAVESGEIGSLSEARLALAETQQPQEAQP